MGSVVRLLRSVLILSLLAALIAPLAPAVPAQEPSGEFQALEAGTGSLLLIASDEFGSPVNGVCFSIDGDTQLASCTGTSGESLVEGLAVGTYSVEAIAPPDYSTSGLQTVEVPDGGTGVAAFTLNYVIPTPTPTSDTTAPSANFISPQPDATLNGTVTISAFAADPSGVAFVRFEYSTTPSETVGWVLIAHDTDGTDGWSGELDTTAIPDGPVTIRLFADDILGNSLNTIVNVTISNLMPTPTPTVQISDPDTSAPSANFISPQPDATLAGTVTISAYAEDPSGVAQVRFDYSTTPSESASWVTIAIDTDGTDGWSAELDTTAIPNGPVRVRLYADDIPGNSLTTNINFIIANPVAAPDLQVAVTASDEVVTASETVNFDITVTNAGDAPAHDVMLVDELPYGMTWSIDAGDSECMITESTLVCAIGTIAAGDSVTIRVTGATSTDDCGVLYNTAVVSASNAPGADDSASVTIHCPDLDLVVAPGMGVINAGDLATFTITVTNNGPGTAHNVIVVGDLPPGYWTVASDAAVCAGNVGTLECALGNLAPGASVTIVVSRPTDTMDCGVISNAASVAASNEPFHQMSNNDSTGSISINCPSGIQVTLLDENNQPLPGGCFELYETVDGIEFSAYLRTLCDDSNGVTRFPDVPGGSYIVRQSNSPSMYPRMGHQVVTVTEGELALVTFTAPLGGKVTIRFFEGTEPAFDFSASVHVDDGTGDPGDFVGNGQDDNDYDGPDIADGAITIDHLAPGNHVIISGHTGVYLNPGPVLFTITPGEDKVVDIQVQRGGTLRFSTTDANGSPLLGSCFYLRTGDPNPQTVDHLCDGHDGDFGTEDGITTFFKLTTGTYYWEQTIAAPNYIAGQTGTIEVTLGQESIVPVENILAGSIVVTLLDEQGTPLPQGYFRLVQDLGDGTRATVAWACDSCDGYPDGVATFNGVPAGTYIVVHQGTLNNDLLAPEVPVTVITGQATPVEMQVERGKVLKLRNIDSGTSSPITDGCFSLRAGGADGDIIAERCDRDDSVIPDAVTVFDGLSAGTYYWEQTVSPWIYVGGGSGVITLTTELEFEIDVPIDVGGAVVITLQDDEGLLLTGGWFRIERDLGDGSREIVATGCDACDGSLDGVTTMNGIPVGPNGEMAQYILVQQGAISGYLPADETDLYVNFSQVSRPTITNVRQSGGDGEPPVANQDNVTTGVGQAVTISVLANDTDADTPVEELTVALLPADGPAHGTVALDATDPNAIIYTPNPGFFGVDSFYYEVSDGSNVAAGAVRITVVGNNVLHVTSLDPSGSLLPWRCFELWTLMPDDSVDRLLTYQCDAEGDARTIFSGLGTGRILLRGYDAPDGMDPIGDLLVSVGPDQVTAISVSYELAQGTGALVINATHGADLLNGACWRLTQYPEIPQNGYFGCDSYDEADGQTRMYGVEPGVYTLRQQITPAGFLTPADQTIEISAGEIRTLEVEHVEGNALHVSTRRSDGSIISGVCAFVYSATGEVLTMSCDSEFGDGGQDGTIVLPVLPPGDYLLWIYNGVSDNDYLPVREYLFSVTADNEVISEQGGDTLNVVYLPGGGVTIRFVDEQTEPLTRMLCYTIFHDAGAGVRGTPLNLDYGCASVVYETSYVGDVTLSALAPGNYLFALTAPLNGYALTGDVPFTVIAGQNSSLTVAVGVQASGAAASLSMTTANAYDQPIATASIGQAIKVVFTFANTGTVDLTNIQIESGSGAIITTYPALPIDWGQLTFFETYIVTEADAGRGSITFTGTAMTEEASDVTASWTLQIVAAPNTEASGEPVNAAGGTGATLTFTGIDQAGFTAVTPLTEPPAQELPGSFSVEGALFFEISTTATFTGDVLVCIPYAPGSIPNARLLHFTGGDWVDITSVDDSSDGRVCGITNHFSPFAIVELLDSDGPVIATPDPIIAEATSAAGATVTFQDPTAVDAGTGLATLTCSHASDDTFAIGMTTVTCSAEDNAGNTSWASFTITVEDTTAPVFTETAPITVEATSPSGAAVTFVVPAATDLVSGAVLVSCDQTSGATFPIGATTVTCSAEDGAGNAGTASFTITVQTTLVPTNKNQCKNNGWKRFNNPFFVDQGSCVAYLEKKK